MADELDLDKLEALKDDRDGLLWNAAPELIRRARRLERIERAGSELDKWQRTGTLYAKEQLPKAWEAFRAALEKR